jgi:hypothetical protein
VLVALCKSLGEVNVLIILMLVCILVLIVSFAGEIHISISLAQNYSEETGALAHWASFDLASKSDKSAELVKGSSLPNIPIEISIAVSESDEIQVIKEDKSNGGPSFVNKLYQIFKSKDAEAHAPPDSNLDNSSNILEETPSQ